MTDHETKQANKLKMAEARKRSLKMLSQTYGNDKKLAKILGYAGPSYISQIMHNHRVMSDRKARDIEALLKKPEGWMDWDHRGEGASRRESVAIDIVTRTVANAIKKLGAKIDQEETMIRLVVLSNRHIEAVGKIDDEFIDELVKLASS